MSVVDEKEVPEWTLDSALSWIRERQPAVMAAGWYMALAGGVLNNGSSRKDLDLVLMPRTSNSRREQLILLGLGDGVANGKGETLPGGFHHVHQLEDGRVVEMTLVPAEPPVTMIDEIRSLANELEARAQNLERDSRRVHGFGSGDYACTLRSNVDEIRRCIRELSGAVSKKLQKQTCSHLK